MLKLPSDFSGCAEEQHRHLGLCFREKTVYSFPWALWTFKCPTAQEWGSKSSSYQGFISVSQTFRDNREKASDPCAWVTLQPRSIPTDQGTAGESPHHGVGTGLCAAESSSCIAREQKKERRRRWEGEDSPTALGKSFPPSKDGAWGRRDTADTHGAIHSCFGSGAVRVVAGDAVTPRQVRVRMGLVPSVPMCRHMAAAVPPAWLLCNYADAAGTAWGAGGAWGAPPHSPVPFGCAYGEGRSHEPSCPGCFSSGIHLVIV